MVVTTVGHAADFFAPRHVEPLRHSCRAFDDAACLRRAMRVDAITARTRARCYALLCRVLIC